METGSKVRTISTPSGRAGVCRVLAVMLLAWGSLAANAATTELRLNNPLPESRPETRALMQFAADVGARSQGALTIRVINGGSLGIKDYDVLRVLPEGAVDMSLLWANYLGRDAPALALAFIQGSVATIAELERALPVVREIYEAELADWGVTAAGYLGIPMLEASIFCRDQPVRTLADLRGRKLRVWTRDQVSAFRRLGIAAQIIPQADMYFAMKTGVVDCAVYPALYAHTVTMDEIAGYASYLYPMAAGPYVLGIATTRWQSLTDEQRSWISDAATAMWMRSNDYAGDHQRDLAARQALGKKGVTWLDDFPAADRERFLLAVSATWEELADGAGGNAPEYRKRVLQAIGR